MQFTPVKTRIFRAKDSLSSFIIEHIPLSEIQEGMVLAVTSKIVSLAEGRLVPRRQDLDKETLIRQESDVFLGPMGYGAFLTVKHGVLLPSAGIDESNSEDGGFILYPIDPYGSAAQLWKQLRESWNLETLGLIITDSRSTPLRKGVTGVALSFAGVQPVDNKIGELDLFERPLKVTQVNTVDALAGAAVLMMGEGAESTPICLIREAPVQFCNEFQPSDLLTRLDEDFYFHFFRK